MKSFFNKDKEAAWIKIAALFKAASGVKPRTAKTLQLKYEGVKKTTKTKAAMNRQEIDRTGDGEVPFSDVEEKVLAIRTNISGLGKVRLYYYSLYPLLNKKTPSLFLFDTCDTISYILY